MIIKSLKSFKYAFLGICWLFKSENNAKIHAIATVSAIALSVFFRITAQEWRWIMLSIALVWISETLNTAIEKIVNLASPGFNTEAGKIKDLGAGAVLLAAIFSLICGTCIFLPYLI